MSRLVQGLVQEGWADEREAGEGGLGPAVVSKEVVAEVDALVTRVVDAWIEEGCPGQDLSHLVARLTRAGEDAGIRGGTPRARRLIQRSSNIAWGEEQIWPPAAKTLCNDHPDCLRSREVAELCWASKASPRVAPPPGRPARQPSFTRLPPSPLDAREAAPNVWSAMLAMSWMKP
jgi:hypothetical protein